MASNNTLHHAHSEAAACRLLDQRSVCLSPAEDKELAEAVFSDARLGGPYEDSNGQNDGTAKDDLENSLQEWCIHVAGANISDCP